MNRHVNAIAGRLSLRPPQRRSLEILDRITEIVPPRQDEKIINSMRQVQIANECTVKDSEETSYVVRYKRRHIDLSCPLS